MKSWFQKYKQQLVFGSYGKENIWLYKKCFYDYAVRYITKIWTVSYYVFHKLNLIKTNYTGISSINRKLSYTSNLKFGNYKTKLQKVILK